MLRNLIFHELKGTFGWSKMKERRLDVSCIKSMAYERRMFCIFDRDKPWTFRVKYEELKVSDNLGIAPTFNRSFGLNGFAFYHETTIEMEHDITVRFEHEEECVAEQEAIALKQYELQETRRRLLHMLGQLHKSD